MKNEDVQDFFSHLSRVNDELGRFIVNLAVGWRGSRFSDADQQEEYTLDSAEAFKSDNPLVIQALENYKDSVSELAAIRNHAEHILRGQDPLGAEINERHPLTNEIRERLELQKGFETQANLGDFAAALGIDKEDAAHLKAFLTFEEAEKRANLPPVSASTDPLNT